MKKAFTLAEVLVTLMIIGVIAAMTLPGLRKNAEMRGLAAGCKKAYASFFYDVNGAKKPNTFGYDIFLFNITKNGILLSAGSYSTSDCVSDSGRGLSCTAKGLKEGAINF